MKVFTNVTINFALLQIFFTCFVVNTAELFAQHTQLNITTAWEVTAVTISRESSPLGTTANTSDVFNEGEEGERTRSGVEFRNMITSSVGFVCNGIALMALIYHKDFSPQFKIHMMSITVADLIVNIDTLVISVSRALFESLSPVFCIFVMSLAFSSIHINSPLALALALDRMYAVFAPLRYKIQTYPSLKAVLLVAIMTVLTSAMTSAAFIRGPQPTPYCYAFSIMTDEGFVLPGFVTSACTCATTAIYLALICRLTLCRRHTVTVQPRFERPVMSLIEVERTRRVTVRSSVLIAWICISYLPFGLYLFYIGVSKVDRSTEVGTSRFIVLTLSPYLNAIVDPFIVFWSLGSSSPLFQAVRHRLFPRPTTGHAASSRGLSGRQVNSTRLSRTPDGSAVTSRATESSFRSSRILMGSLGPSRPPAGAVGSSRESTVSAGLFGARADPAGLSRNSM